MLGQCYAAVFPVASCLDQEILTNCYLFIHSSITTEQVVKPYFDSRKPTLAFNYFLANIIACLRPVCFKTQIVVFKVCVDIS